jgi:photosynthetic reaction center H subunit
MMEIGALTSYIDVAQMVLYAFWVFFFGLVLYLRMEDKREGYPLQADPAVPSDSFKSGMEGFPSLPTPKVFRLADGTTRLAPRDNGDTGPLAAQPAESWPGAPLVPTGNPMRDAVGPAAYAQRPNIPDKTMHGTPRIVPMRVAPDFHVDDRDPDPRAMQVIAADGKYAGIVNDIWVDRAEPLIRYLEVELTDLASGEPGSMTRGSVVLLPIGFARIDDRRKEVRVASITAGQFADVPRLQSPDEVTLLEEDRIMAYYGGGHLYATADRQEPFL